MPIAPSAEQLYGLAEGALERLEGLEQLRFLDQWRTSVRCVASGRPSGRVFWELNNPEDVARIEGP